MGSAGASAVKKSGKWKAFLAGGLVLGIGAAVTLASWNDSEFATGLFGAGQYDLEGSVDGAAYAEHDDPGLTNDADLDFQLSPDNLAPGDVVYAPFAVRLAALTTSAAVVTTTSTGSGANAANLTYSLFTTATFGCTSGSTPVDVLAGPGTALTAAPVATFPLATGTPTTVAGAAVNLCFVVTAGAGLTQGDQATATWEFAAESQ